ncbi:MFS transporter [Pseudarthrobacter sp. C1]|uniref:MFS transporter n=1 Tax=Pseudarthrobacter sp. C1 TaxID=3108940 RepID=UPI002B053D48|nr:MFS transporter [Pseudarthrobacter sp. C1]MEA3551024.1 MFS transporter [Pseudarthrobacter sp. C1]
MPLGLIALAAGGFGIGLTEFVILGLLPEVASDFNVSIPVAGYLVSVYALSVAFGGIFVTAVAAGRNPKNTLALLMVLFITGNLISALSPDYTVMLIGRIVAALCHGAFFGVGAVLAANLVEPHRKAAAVSIMFAGLTTANVLGVPFGTFLGQNFGWRSTFWAITGIGIIALIGMLAFIRTQPANQPANLRLELSAFTNVQVWLSILVTVFGFGAFTYITPMLTQVAGFPETAVPWMLVLFGVGLFAGNIFGGQAADRNLDKSLDKSLLVLLCALAVILFSFTVALETQWTAAIALFLLGVFGFAAVPGMQVRVLHFAQEAPTLASGVNISAFNVGNALGAHLGGITITAGMGYASPTWVGGCLAITAIIFMVSSIQRLKSRGARHGNLKNRLRRARPSQGNAPLNRAPPWSSRLEADQPVVPGWSASWNQGRLKPDLVLRS